MEETSASFPILYAVLNWFMLGGGLLVATVVWRWHRRNPPDREQCTGTIVSRAWDPIHLGILLLAIFALYFLAAGSGRFFYEEQLPAARLIIVVSIYVVLIVATGALNLKRGRTWENGFGMGVRQLKQLRLAPVLYLAAIPVLMIATQGYHWILSHWFGLEITMQDAAQAISEERSWVELGYILAAIVVAPVYEEVLFRGILFPYAAKYIGTTRSVLAVSLLFGLIHFHIPSILPLFLLSVALCLAYWRTGSLWVGIGIHAIFNAVGTLAIKLVY